MTTMSVRSPRTTGTAVGRDETAIPGRLLTADDIAAIFGVGERRAAAIFARIPGVFNVGADRVQMRLRPADLDAFLASLAAGDARLS